MTNRVVDFIGGSHGNFLSLVINVLTTNTEYKLLGNTFDSIGYTNNKRISCVPFYNASKDNLSDIIRIEIDNEILWLHQMICRAGDKNYHINKFEKNFIINSIDHFILSSYVKYLIQLNRKTYPKFKKKTLKWFYKNQLFGNFVSQQRNKTYKHIFPFSAFYNFEKFVHHVNLILPNSDQNILKPLYDKLHNNLVHTDKNIHQTGSILYESWQEYQVDRS